MDAYKETDHPRSSTQRRKIIPDYDHLFDETPNTVNKKGKTRLLSKLVKMNRKQLFFSLILYVIQVAPVFAFSLISANIINIVTEALTGPLGFTDEALRSIIINCAVFLGLLAVHVPTTMLRFSIVSKIMRNTSAGIKNSVIRKLQSLSITYQKDMQVGKIQSKFLKDIETTDNLFRMLLIDLVYTVINAIIAIIISIVSNGFVALFFLVAVPFNVIVARAFRKNIRKRNHQYRLDLEDMSAKLTTMIEMIPVTKAHGLEQTEIQETEQYVNKLKESGIKLDKTNACFGSAIPALNLFLSGACLIFCTFLAIKGVIRVGDVVLFQAMFTQLSNYISSLVGLTPQITSGFESLNSLGEIMNVKDVEYNIGKKKFKNVKGEIEFKNVSYRYPNTDQLVVKDFNLKVEAGECIAVVGSSGSGKSTLMNLIIGFLQAESGEILVDGKPMKDYDLTEYRHNISVVPQSSILFSGSIRDNITYGLDRYTNKELDGVVEMANLNEFVKDLPCGLDTSVGEHGDKLSGGQKQRVTIARALIRNPRILILDEATSALDNISEYHVQKAISSSIEGRTTFIVAHRLSTIRNADKIVVMENGEMVECGTYDELMAKQGKFFRLKQLSDLNSKKAEEELA